MPSNIRKDFRYDVTWEKKNLYKFVVYYKPSEGKHGTAKCPVLVKINDRENFNLAYLLGK